MRTTFFAPGEPHAMGMLDVGEGHTIRWESCGNPDGVPIVYLHGGPGGGFSKNQRGFFDPAKFRAVLFDQRGCGQSKPQDDGSAEWLATNTTDHLIADTEMLRMHLGIEQWAVLGLSWGTTLAIAYALVHPTRVTAMVLGLVTTTSRREVEWITEDVGRIFPREWARFNEAVLPEHRSERLVDAYASMLASDDATVRHAAALEWCLWEDAHVSLAPGSQPSPMFDDADFRYRFARLVTHYWRASAFRGDSELLDRAHELQGIPATLIHGRFDVSSPLETAVELSRKWGPTDLRVLDDGGHGTGDSFPIELLAALDRISPTES